MSDEHPRGMPGRRAVLFGAAALGLAGCTEAPAPGGAGSPSATSRIPEPSSSSTSETPTPTTSAPPPLPASRVYPIAPNEPEPVAKEKAVRLVEATSAWGAGGSSDAAVTARLTAQGISGARAATFAAATAPYRGNSPEATSGVIAVQYGGLTATLASLL
ncbi:MAG TPA: hypothetical protein VFR40_06975, partial [Lapillicoccus sp.]|nr:hypothetical protein [Lapillicoccus sp.]